MTNTLCKIQLLGGLRAQIGEREITRFRTQKAASLLAYLAYYRHQSHPREVLIEMLWPECDPKVGRSRLSNAFWALRRELEPPGTPAGTLLQANHFAIGLNPSLVTTDVADFLAACRKATRAADPSERKQYLREAGECYTGELLPGFYEDWILTEQQRLAELFQQVQRDLRARAKQESIHEATSEPALLPRLPDQSETAASLPTTFTRFFGRTELLEELHQWLSPASARPARPRLVTITGTGGMGKTRLSLEVARGLLEDYSGAVWFVPLAEVSEPTLIGSALVEALQLPRSGSVEPLKQVISFLQERKDAPSLLVLDNFEQLVEGGAEIVQTLLEQVPGLICLVTSRRLLNLSHEQEIVLQPLPTPRGEVSPDYLTMYESVRLFVDRAKAVRPTFAVTNQNAPDVAELCYRLEGIPLAIELAAARAQVLTPAQILTQLQQRFAFLISRKRDVAARHQTLHAAIEWSYRLLAPELQRLFRCLSVFRGGWTLEAAESVCEELQALEYLEQLREWSLVQVEETEQGIRFHILETLREYGLEQLAAEERDAARRRHAHYFLSFAEGANFWPNPPDGIDWFQRTETELENLHTAFAMLQETEPADALRLAVALRLFWHRRGRAMEGRTQLEAALAYTGSEHPDKRARALIGAATLARLQGDYNTAHHYFEQCRVLGEEQNNLTDLFDALLGLAHVASEIGDTETAQVWYSEALAIAQELGDIHREATMLCNLGVLAMERGHLEEAKQLYQQSLQLLLQENKPYWIALVKTNLANVYEAEQNYAEAKRLNEEVLAYHRELESKPGIALSLHNLGGLALETGDIESAMFLLEESLALRRETGEQRGVASNLHHLGIGYQKQNNLAQAKSLLMEALSIQRAIEEPLGEARTLIALSKVARQAQDCSLAWEHARESLRIQQRLNTRLHLGETLENMAWILAAWKPTSEGQRPAARLLGAAQAAGEQLGLRAGNQSVIEDAARTADLRNVLGEEAFTQEWETGHKMTYEQAITFAQEVVVPEPAEPQ